VVAVVFHVVVFFIVPAAAAVVVVVLACNKDLKEENEFFLDHLFHWATLISISVALSQTPAYNVRPRIRG